MLNKGQRFAYSVLLQGYNVYLTGGAGTGKTFVINKFINTLRNNKKNVMICAPTGIAALNIGGVTIHRQFKAPLGVILNYKYNRSDELIRTDTIIIDEISMCRIDLFDFICRNIADANSVRRGLGLKNIQIVLVGDFFQLAPVMREYEKNVLDKHYGRDIGVGFAFMSQYWDMLELNTIVLTETMRQDNKQFISDLNNIRIGNKAYIDSIYNNSCKHKIEDAIIICGKNQEVNEINQRELSRINSVSTYYQAILSGDVLETDTLAEFNLELRPGARVMTLVNSEEYTNGMLGTVEALYNDSVYVSLDETKRVVCIDRYHWDITRYEVEETQEKDFIIQEVNVGYIEQFPLKLAYAITIHKSQGQTYSSVNISPYCWDCGQLYVAISRCARLENIHFNYAPDIKYLVISLNVIKFENNSNVIEIRKVSDEYIKELEDKIKPQKQSFGEELDNLLSKLSGN